MHVCVVIGSYSSSYYNSLYLVCRIRDIRGYFSSAVKKDVTNSSYSSRVHFVRFLFINYFVIESLGTMLEVVRVW